jgi:hypothetical protein
LAQFALATEGERGERVRGRIGEEREGRGREREREREERQGGGREERESLLVGTPIPADVALACGADCSTEHSVQSMPSGQEWQRSQVQQHNFVQTLVCNIKWLPYRCR